MTHMRHVNGRYTHYQEWTPEQNAILIDAWKRGGLKTSQPLFPDRTPGSLRGRANRLGLYVAGRNGYIRQPANDWIDAQIRREYATGAPKLKPLARRLSRTLGWVKWRAGELGLRNPASTEPYASWTAAEDAIIEGAIDDDASVRLMKKRLAAAGYRRSLESIRRRVWGLHGGFRRGYYTSGEVAALFGVDRDLVQKWINAGALIASRRPGQSMDAGRSSGARHYKISPHAISRFMREHPTLWDHRKMRREALLEFLLGEHKALGRIDELQPRCAA
jgi:hypothetical protein